MKRNQSGFTLIEIAIVLVIIGLLLGGVLKGQELINSAKVKNLATDFKNVPVFIYGYQDKFKALPGDDVAAATHVTGASDAGDGDGIIEGAWNSSTTTDESVNFWQHVRLAGLAPGPTTVAGSGDYIPKNAVGGIIGVTNSGADNPITLPAATPLRGSYIVCSGSIAGKFAKQLDTTLDDSNTATGSMMVLDPAVASTSIATASIVDDTTYTVCMGF
ncbi:MAG: prepilin-type N-terminal cleavage/methylation domain-containing protein [Gallionellales bacterium GWA2_60_18]|nr:MAG: prepilin-type N-terminal cleavage/methylation domain-containing protein [Gallionellales bacterium GWA2_60_18]